jgi:Mor family transcriptional regulator
MNKTILKHAALLHPDFIMQPYDEMMNRHGFEMIYCFSECLGGRTIYVPSARTIFSRCLEEEVRKEYNGKNVPYLTRKYGFSERHLRRLLGF